MRTGRRDVVLLHGWGFGAGIWDRLAGLLPRALRTTTLDLPGYGNLKGGALPQSVEATAWRVLGGAPAPALWVGWSFGGMVALAVAAARPERVAALVLVGASAKFLAAADWPAGVQPSQLNDFRVRLAQDPRACLIGFARLAAWGSTDVRATHAQLLRCLNAAPLPSLRCLRHGLDLLAGSDLRAALARMQCPVVLVRGEGDAFVSATAAGAMRALNPTLAVITVAGGGTHCPSRTRARSVTPSWRCLDDLPSRG